MKRTFHIDFGHANDNSIDYLIGILKDARLTTIRSVKKLTVEQIDWQFSTWVEQPRRPVLFQQLRDFAL